MRILDEREPNKRKVFRLGPRRSLARVKTARGVMLGTALLSGASIAKIGLQLIVIPLLARLLGPQTYGLMSVAASLVYLANMLSDGGMSAALVREHQPAPALESTVFWISVAIGIGLMAILCAMAWPLSEFYSQPELIPVLCALSPILLLSSGLSVSNAQIIRAQRFGLFATADIFSSMTGAAIGVALAFAGYGIWSLVAQQLSIWTIRAVWVVWACPFRPGLILRPQLTRPLFHFSANNLASNIADFAGKSAPVLIVGGLLGVSAAGIYSMAYQLTRIAENVISGPIGVATFSGVAVAEDHAKAVGFANSAFRGLTIVLLPIFCGLALTADLFTPVLLGPKWAATAPTLIAMTPGAFFICFYSFASSALLGNGQAAIVLKLTLLSGCALAVGTAAGATVSDVAAGVGFSAAASLLAFVYVNRLARMLQLSAGELLRPVWPCLVSAAAMVCAVHLVRMQIDTLPPLLQLFIAAATGALVYAATVASIDGKRIRRDIALLLKRPPERAMPAGPA